MGGPYGTGRPDTDLGELSLSYKGPLVEPGKITREPVEDDKKTRVTIVVTLGGMGSIEPLRSPKERPPDAGTVEEYVAIPGRGSVVKGT